MSNDTQTPNVNIGEQNVPENLAEQSGLPNMSSTKVFKVETDMLVLGDVYADNFIGRGAAGGTYATQVGFNPNDPLDVASLVMDAGTDGTDGYLNIANITADGTVDFTGATLIGIPDLVGISLTDLSVSVNAVGVANLEYDNTTGVFTYTPPSFAGYLPVSGGTLTGPLTTSADINFGDNDKATFGAGDDLQIYHDGTQSRIVDAGTGNLKIQAQNFAVNNVADDENMITAEPDGFVKLFHNGSEKIRTDDTGIDVTGSVSLTGSVVAGTGTTNAATLNAYSKTVSTNLPSALRVIENTGASSYWDIGSTGGASNNLNFYANANTTPKMTLNGAGNLLVGKTVADLTTTGIQLSSAGFISASRPDVSAVFNRRTTDGDIMLLRKDGTTVGSIQSRAGLVSTIILDPRTNGAGLTGASQEIQPTNGDGTQVDGVISLGDDNNGFKNLYLGGGVYLGGTGAANKLDDYEEGTWTPTLGGGATATDMTGIYTKVGRLVTVTLALEASTITGAPNHIITGLPFANGPKRSSFPVTYLDALEISAINVSILSAPVAAAACSKIRLAAPAATESSAALGSSLTFWCLSHTCLTIFKGARVACPEI